MTNNVDSLRINLVVRQDREGELFTWLQSVFAGVPERDRAEVLRRELSVQLALHRSTRQVPQKNAPCPGDAAGSRPNASALDSAGSVAEIAPLAAAPQVYDMQLLAQFDMHLDDYIGGSPGATK